MTELTKQDISNILTLIQNATIKVEQVNVVVALQEKLKKLLEEQLEKKTV
jgi:hypothetical protein